MEPPSRPRRPRSPMLLLPAHIGDVLDASVSVLVVGPVSAATVQLRSDAMTKTGEAVEVGVEAAVVEVDMMQLRQCHFHTFN